MTLRELLVRHEAWQVQQWDLAAAVVWRLELLLWKTAADLGSPAHAKRPVPDFQRLHPFRAKQAAAESAGLTIGKENWSVLREVF
jgi:hypothetical protein